MLCGVRDGRTAFMSKVLSVELLKGAKPLRYEIVGASNWRERTVASAP